MIVEVRSVFKVQVNSMNEGIEFTGERFMPEVKNMQLALEHYQRYQSVLKLVSGKTVLDAACGEGYGSQMLAQAALQVTGLDISRDAIANARQKYISNNLCFLEGSITDLPADTGSIDIVISFETIEHVPIGMQVRFLEEIDRVLKPDGILVMSTPNREPYNSRTGQRNQFHVHEFTLAEFKQFLQTRFQSVQIFHQITETVNLIYQPLSETNAAMDSDRYGIEGTYLIALACRQTGACQTNLSHIAMPWNEQHQPAIERILILQDEVESRNRHILSLDQELEQARSRILALQAEVDERNAHLQRLDAEIEKLRNKNKMSNK